MHCHAPTSSIVRQGGAVASYESRGGASSTTSLFADKSLWYTLQRLKSTHTPKKVRFVCWTHRQKMPTTRPTIAVNLFTIFIGTRAVCVENTKLQPLTRGIPNVEPDRVCKCPYKSDPQNVEPRHALVTIHHVEPFPRPRSPRLGQGHRCNAMARVPRIPNASSATSTRQWLDPSHIRLQCQLTGPMCLVESIPLKRSALSVGHVDSGGANSKKLSSA